MQTQADQNFLRTSTDKGHYHLIYAKPDGSMAVSQANGHVHEVVRQEQVAAIPGGAVLGALPQASVEVQVFLGEAKGHSHAIEGPYIPVEKGEKTDKDKVVREIQALFREAKGLEDDFRKKGDESEKFYSGEGQWSETDKQALEGKKRSALTINEIESKIDVLRGHQSQNRYDIRYFPVENGDSAVADILNILAKNICEQTNYDYEETWAFEDQAIVGRGFLDIFVDYDRNLEGDIRITKFPWKDCYLGPHEKPTLEDLEYLIKTRWFSFAKVKQLWPDAADDIEGQIKLLDEVVESGEQGIDGDKYEDGATNPAIPNDPDLVNIAKKEYRVLECWRKEYSTFYVLANPADDVYVNTDGWPKADVDKAATISGFRKISRRKTMIRVTTVAGGVLLDNEINDLFDDEFSITAAYGKKRGKSVWGKVEAVKDLQKEINKRHSQFTDILNKVAAYGWFYDSMTFDSPEEEKKFRANSSTPGFTVKVVDVNRTPKQADGVKFPSEIAQMIANDSMKVRELMNVNGELLGQTTRAESGIAIAHKKAQGLLGNEFLFDNLALAKRLIGRKLLKLIPKIYTPERIMRVVQSMGAKENIQIAGLPLDQVNPVAVMEILKNTDLSQYDVAVGQSAHSPTARMTNFILWSEMAAKGVPVPPMLLVDLSDLPDKEKVKAMMMQMQQAEAEAEQKKYGTEIAKARIAASKGQGGPTE
jgi:hypothetical protein